MVIFDLNQRPPAQLFNDKIFCALARDLDRTGKLNPEGAQEALEGIARYAAIVAEHGHSEALDVVGTAALREAQDGPDFIAWVKQRTGLDIRLIDGHQEAKYAALGVQALDPQAHGIVADFGGGSLEFAQLETGRIGETISLPFGAYRALAMDDRAEKLITAGLQNLALAYGHAPALYTIGGSWRALAQAYILDHDVSSPELQGYAIPRDRMISFCSNLMGMSPEECRERYHFEDKRSQLAPVSALVLRTVLAVLKPEKMVVSLAGIRDGIVYDRIVKGLTA